MDSSLLDAKKAAEELLKTSFPAVKIAFENIKFTPPTKELYFETQFLIQNPVDPVFSAGYHREQVQFQIFVFDVLGTGTGNVLSKALAIRDIFYKGRTMLENTTQIHILQTPHIAGSMMVADKIVVPVIINLTVEVDLNV